MLTTLSDFVLMTFAVLGVRAQFPEDMLGTWSDNITWKIQATPNDSVAPSAVGSWNPHIPPTRSIHSTLKEEDIVIPKLNYQFNCPAPAQELTSIFTIETCSDVSYLSSQQALGLRQTGYTKCLLALGVLVVGSSDYPDSYLITAGNVLAGLLDQDQDGIVDDATIASNLLVANGGPVLHGKPHAGEREGDALDRCGFAYGFSLQAWHACQQGEGWTRVRSIITEEAFHMVTEYGYARAFPRQFATTTFTSVACEEMAAAQCVTWLHPQNRCPRMGTHTPPPLQGSCNEPRCDCTEWFHQVALVLADMQPGWTSVLLPSSKAALEASLSSEFKAMMAKREYHMLRSPLTYVYSPGTAGNGGNSGNGGDSDGTHDNVDGDGDKVILLISLGVQTIVSMWSMLPLLASAILLLT